MEAVPESTIIAAKSGKISEIKVKKGASVAYGKLLAVFDDGFKVKARGSGKVTEILVRVGDEVEKGLSLMKIRSGCSHPTVMKDMCAECGADLRKVNDSSSFCFSESSSSNENSVSASGAASAVSASIAMVHSIPELKVSSDEAHNLGQEDERRLLKHRKLVLLVDLDQTVIHTTNENIPPNIKDVYHFQLYGPRSPWYHTRIRPRTTEFLEAISKYYELHICTFGARMYAHTIAGFLDPNSKYFSHRILSRDECFNNRSKTANLSALFPCGDHMVCIIDDREDVWNYARNLVHVKPYHFFKNTGDINAPPGLTKTENDNKEGIDFDKITAGGKKKKTPKYSDSMKAKKERSKKVSEPPTPTPNPAPPPPLPPPPPPPPPPLAVERRDSIDMPTLDSGEKGEVDAISMVSDDLELSDENSNSSSDDDKKESANDNGEKSEDKKDDKPKKKEEISDLDSDDDDEEPEEEDEGKKTDNSNQEDDLIELEDHDDYLMYLEDILKTIHKAYYDLYDQMQAEGSDGSEDTPNSSSSKNKVPDLKNVIPYVKRKVLQGTSIVFSGVIPTHVKLEQSKPYMVARSLGARVTEKLENPGTTHLIAARLGTAKVNDAKRIKGICCVTPDWLWGCAERWEKIDERLFPLTKSANVTLKPPAHCSSPEIAFAERCGLDGASSSPPSTSETLLPEIHNPFIGFSSEDLQGMDKEIDEMLSADDSSEEEESAVGGGGGEKKRKKEESEAESSSEDSLTGDRPKGWGKNHKRLRGNDDKKGDCCDDDDDEEDGYEKFKRGTYLPKGFEIEKKSDDEANDDDDDNRQKEEDDDDDDDDVVDDDDEDGWGTMAANLEREFLGDDNSLSNQ